MRDIQFKYEALAKDIENNIKSGLYQVGEKLPSIRDLHKKMNVSVVTVNKALEELERIGLIESKPKSGYYVKLSTWNSLEEPSYQKCFDHCSNEFLFMKRLTRFYH